MSGLATQPLFDEELEERAAILEFDGGLPRPAAEQQAQLAELAATDPAQQRITLAFWRRQRERFQ